MEQDLKNYLLNIAIIFIILIGILPSIGNSTENIRLPHNDKTTPNILNVPLIVQEALKTNTKGIKREKEPLTVGVPLPQNSGITSVNQLGLIGTSSAQFRVLARWPNENIKWVLIDTLVTIPAEGKSIIYLTNGYGNYGGNNLATEDPNYVYIDTGLIQVRIRKYKFNLFDKVTINGKPLIEEGKSQGILVEGRRADEKELSLYTSKFGEEKVIIEENGPVKTVIKVDGILKNSKGKTFTGYTVRMYFYKGRSYIRVVFVHKNGFSKLKENVHFRHVELKTKLSLSGDMKYKVSLPENKQQSSVLYFGENLVAFQGRSTAFTGTMGVNSIHRSPDDIKKYEGRGIFIYEVGNKTGYEIKKNGNVIYNGTEKQHPDLFYLDMSDSSGMGATIGIKFAAGWWPKSLFASGNGDIIVSPMPSNNPDGYWMIFGSHQTTEIHYDFHYSEINSEDSMKKFQYHLVARAPVNWYNDCNIFLGSHKLVSFLKEAEIYQSLGIKLNTDPSVSTHNVLTRKPSFNIIRYWNYGQGGGMNQNDFALINLLNSLREDKDEKYSDKKIYLGEYFLSAQEHFRYNMDRAIFHSDDYDAGKDLCLHKESINCKRPTTVRLDDPFQYYATYHHGLRGGEKVGGYKTFFELEHVHWYGLPLYYYITGDERIKENILDHGEWMEAILKNEGYGSWQWRFGACKLWTMSIIYQFMKETGLSEKSYSLYLNEANKVFNEFLKQGHQDPFKFDGFSWTRGSFGLRFTDYKNNQSPVQHTLSAYRYNFDAIYWYYKILPESDPMKDKARDIMEGMTEMYYKEIWNNDKGLYSYLYGLDEVPNQGGYYCGTDALSAGFELTGDNKYVKRMKEEIKMLDDGRAFGIYYYQDAPHLQTQIYHIANTLKNTPPNKVRDLTATYLGRGKVKLEWTSPGGEKYRIKYANKSIVEHLNYDPINKKYQYDPEKYNNWWSAENVLNEPVPKPQGQKEEFIIENLNPGKIYYFALQSERAPSLISEISNIFSIRIENSNLILR